MTRAPDLFPALLPEIEEGVDSLHTDSLRHGHPRVLRDLHLLNRHQSTSEIGVAARQDDICGAACINRFEEPLNDTTSSKTPPPSRSNASAATLGCVDSEQAGATGKQEQPCDATPDITVLCTLRSTSPHEDVDAGRASEFADCDLAQ
jgi:hypothetical protein